MTLKVQLQCSARAVAREIGAEVEWKQRESSLERSRSGLNIA